MTIRFLPQLSWPALLGLALLFAALQVGALPVGAQTLPEAFSTLTQTQRPLDPAEAFKVTTERAPDGALIVHLDIAPGYHLYRDRLTAKTESGRALRVESPPGVIDNDPNFGDVEIWRKPVTATVLSHGGAVVLGWQGCEEAGVCYPPQSRVVAAMSGAKAEPAATTSAEAKPATPPATSSGGLVAGLLAQGGGAWLILAFFGFGVLLAFTPCVLPMVPVVAGMLAAQGTRLTPGRGFALSAAYVLAMALAFGALGLVAAWSGQNLQMALQAPPVIWAMAALFAVLALASFGLFDLRMPEAIARRLSGRPGRRGTLVGAAVLGFTSALVIGPCVTAPLAGALLYIAQTGNAALGAVALFALGLGQGVPLIAVGLFGAAVLPRMGPWMEGVRALFGFVFLALAIYLAGRVLPGPATLALWAFLLIAAGLFLGARDRLEPGTGPARRLGMALGITLMLAGALEGIGAAAGGGDPWQPLAGLGAGTPQGVVSSATSIPTSSHAATPVSTPAALKAALAAAPGPALVEISADWCTSCRTIEREVLPQPAVQAALAPFTVISVDVTHNSLGDRAILKELGSVGPPTFVFFDAAHREVPGTRLVGEFTAPRLIAALTRSSQAGATP